VTNTRTHTNIASKTNQHIKAYLMFLFFITFGLYYTNITACSRRLIYLFVFPILRSVAHAAAYENNP